MKLFLDRCKAYAPALSAVLVLILAAGSLSGYQAPSYAAAEDRADEKEQETAETGETVTKGFFDLADGVYKGTGTGFSGDITVAVQIKDKQIVSIDILSSSDDEAFFNRAKAVIDRIIEAQSLDVDVVSGATYSSNGIISAVKNALTGEKDSSETGASKEGTAQSDSTPLQAAVDAAAYRDGTYYGTGTGFAGTVRVQVVISGGKIASIQVVQHSDGSSYMQKASGLISNILATQSTDVDTVSGATFSSKGIILAVRDALRQAAVTVSDAAASASSSSDTQKKEITESKEGTVPYVDGIYHGTAEGYQGDITVAVVLQDHTIKAILVEDSQDDEAFFGRAMDVVKNVIKNQNTDVDTVSGATYSSKGLLQAIGNALKEAEKATNGENTEEQPDTAQLEAAIAAAELLSPGDYTEASWAAVELRLQDAKEARTAKDQDTIDQAAEKLSGAVSALERIDGGDEGTIYRNGTYSVSVLCSPDEDGDFDAYNLSATVTIRGDRIVSITDVSGDGASGNGSYIRRAANGTSSKQGVIAQVVEKGTAEEIDTVSGATCTSEALLRLCEKALEQAKR